MASLSVKWGVRIVATAAMAFALMPSATAANPILPRTVVALSAQELEALYGDKTWKWKTGAGRFVEADHSFVAWAESKKTESFAEGHWEATDDGRLCMIATWTNPDGAQDNRTCFVHLRDRGTIYQRREPDGRWYIFKNYLNKPDDEFRKLSQVDSVSAKAERLKKSLEK
jgi:hypothetical protein